MSARLLEIERKSVGLRSTCLNSVGKGPYGVCRALTIHGMTVMLVTG